MRRALFHESGVVDDGTGTLDLAALSGLTDHLADTSDAHDASAISFSPTGSIASTDVQAAIAEVASEAGSGSVTYGTPSLTLGTSNAGGSTDESIRRDATILAFDATAPSTQAFGDSAAAGSATVAARRDHKHAMPTVEGAIHAATGKTTPDDADEFGIVDSAASNVLKKLSGTNLKAYLKSYFDTLYTGSGTGIGTDGWIAISGLSYSSVDGPTGVVSTSSDLTGTIGVGARVKFTQTTVKYFIVTAIDSTTMTLYGGTDYTLANAAISSAYWSPVKAPFGFPLDPTKWTVTATDTNNRTQATPTQNTWYNLGSFSVDIPIGCWRVFFAVCMQVSKGTAATLAIHSALSTANNSASDSLMIASAFQSSPTAVEAPVFRERSLPLVLASKTTYYLNSRTTEASMSAIQFRGDVNTTTISAVCAYL